MLSVIKKNYYIILKIGLGLKNDEKVFNKQNSVDLVSKCNHIMINVQI